MINLDDLPFSLARIADASPSTAAALLARLPIDPGRQTELSRIHSETTTAERSFIYNFMRSVWEGPDPVLEIGTYLGGTTSCLGLGMKDNPGSFGKRLISCDRFQQYHRPDRLIEDTKPLWSDIADSSAIFDELKEGRWRKLFDSLHRPTDYGRFLHIVESSLPDRPGEAPPHALADAVAEAGRFSLLFVDGCISWFGTKAFMRTALPALAPGGWVMLQDYNRHTCFWLPCFFDAARDHFALIAMVSGTATFRYRGGLDQTRIDELYPDAPSGWTEGQFDDCFARLFKRAFVQSDTVSLVVAQIQHAAALAYIGNGVRARAILKSASMLPSHRLYEKTFADALITPTFSPDAPIYLPKAEPTEDVEDEALRCGICGATSFLPGFNGRMNAGRPPMCASCKTVERHRIVRAVYESLRPLLKEWRALHFAPDRSVDPAWFKSYRTSIFGTESGLDMMTTGLPTGSFDIVLSNHVLEHVSDDFQALMESLRLVGPEGVVHCCVPSPIYRWQTTDWGFANAEANEHYRDYGADFALRAANQLPGVHVVAIAGRDPVTESHDLVYLLSHSNIRLEAIATLLRRHQQALVRVR